MKAGVGRWIVAALLGVATASNIRRADHSRPARPFAAPGTCSPLAAIRSRTARAIKWPTPDSVAAALMNKTGLHHHALSGRHGVLQRRAEGARPARREEAPRDRRSRFAGRGQRQRHLLQRSNAPRHDRRPLRVEQPGAARPTSRAWPRRLQSRRTLGERDERALPGQQRRDVVSRCRPRQGRARQHRRRRTPRCTRARIDHELRRLDPGLPLRVPRGEAHRQQHDRRAAGRALHQGHSR